ncbi:MAG: hypothetical protein U9R15_08655 [Chloroflexota bacterium]|nr:hypothetical protein [Chloroflexota bacterium]
MRIAIVGAGIAGRALWRFLELQDRHDVEIFDLKQGNRCGIHPCAWGVEQTKFRLAHTHLQLPIETVYRNFSELNLDGDMIKCNLCTFDKPAFLEQMCSSDNIQTGVVLSPHNDYDLIIDATGEKRAILPQIPDDMKITCRQTLYKTHTEDLDISMFPSKSVGYAWAFPLDNGFVHIGQGAMKWENISIPSRGKSAPEETWKAMRYAGVTGKEPVCGVKESKIRLLTPAYCQPIAWRNIVGVGESIGAVSPHSGAGIIPSITCARLLAENIDEDHRFRHYTAAMMKEFAFMDRETEIVKKLITGRRVNLRDLICLYKNDRWFGLYPGPVQIIRALRGFGARFI